MQRPAHRLHRPATRTTSQPGSIPALPHGRAIVPSRADRDRCQAAAMRSGEPGTAAPGSHRRAPNAPIAAPQAPPADQGRYRQGRESDRPRSRHKRRQGAIPGSGTCSSCVRDWGNGTDALSGRLTGRSRSNRSRNAARITEPKPVRRHRCTRDTRPSHPGHGAGYGIGQSRRTTGTGLSAPRSAAATRAHRPDRTNPPMTATVRARGPSSPRLPLAQRRGCQRRHFGRVKLDTLAGLHRRLDSGASTSPIAASSRRFARCADTRSAHGTHRTAPSAGAPHDVQSPRARRHW